MSKLEITVSVSRKLGDGNFGSGGAELSITGIDHETTEEEMDEILSQGKIAYFKLRDAAKAQATDMLKRGG